MHTLESVTVRPRSWAAYAVLLGPAWFIGCGNGSSADSGNNTGGTAAAGGSASGGSGGSATGGSATGGSATGGSATGGSATGGSATGGSGGSGGISGTPYVFVGSTDGTVRAYVMSTTDGALTAAGSQDVGSLDFMTVGPDDRTIFISASSSVAAYTYDAAEQSFSLVDSTTTSGGGTHVAVDPNGQYVLVAHYNEGALSFFSYTEASGFSSEQSFSPGDNAHQVRIDEAGSHVYVPCLGSNYVAQYALDGGALSAAATPSVAAAGGPRHLDFHPSANVAYVLAELSSEVHVYNLNASTGSLEPRAADSLFTHDDEQFHQSSDIKVTPDGRFVYAVNRQPSEIVRFEVQGDQSLVRLGSNALGGAVRSFAMDPAGRFLQIGGADGNLVALAIDTEDGSLSVGPSVSGLGTIHAAEIRYLVP